MHGGPEVSEDRVRDARKRCPGGYVDVTMLLTLGMILIFGLAMIYSTSSYRAYDLYGDQMYFFKRQALYMLLAILAMYIVSRYDYRRLLRLSAVILLSSLVLQVVVLIIGTASHGSARWIYIGPIGFQPSEYAKTAIIIYTSARAAVESKNLCRPGCLIKVMIRDHHSPDRCGESQHGYNLFCNPFCNIVCGKPQGQTFCSDRYIWCCRECAFHNVRRLQGEQSQDMA